MTNFDERYALTIAEDHNTVRLRDQKTGEAYNFTGAKALYDALGVLADWRDRDRNLGQDEQPSVVIDNDDDEWRLQDDGLYDLVGRDGYRRLRGRTLESIRATYGIKETRRAAEQPSVLIDNDDDEWHLHATAGLYTLVGRDGCHVHGRTLESIRATFGIKGTR